MNLPGQPEFPPGNPHFYTTIANKMSYVLILTPSQHLGYDAWLIFKQNQAALNSSFSSPNLVA